MKLKSSLLMMFIVLLLVVVGCGSNDEQVDSSGDKQATNYPERNINGTIQWGEGGATDIFSRAIAQFAEKELDTSIIMNNRTGASGAVGAQYVYDQKSDGYNLLFIAEQLPIYGVLGISELSFDDFYPINIYGRTVPVIAVAADSPYETLEDVFNDAEQNPGKVKIGVASPGSQGHVVASMMALERDIAFNQVPFDGNGPALTAMLGGHVDITVLNTVEVLDYVEKGDMRILSVVNDEPIEQFPDVPTLGEIDPSFEKYLPWGSWFGVAVKKDTPDEVKEKLVEAFDKAFNDPEFQEVLETSATLPLGLHGEEAMEFINDWQSTTAWIIHDSGESQASPEEFGIPRIDE